MSRGWSDIGFARLWREEGLLAGVCARDAGEEGALVAIPPVTAKIGWVIRYLDNGTFQHSRALRYDLQRRHHT